MLSIIPLIPISSSPSHFEQVMAGLLLGDGSLVKKYKGGGTYFKFAQGAINSDYLYYVFDLFNKQGVVNMVAPSEGKSTVGGKVHKWYQFSTRSIREWNELHSAWYVEGKKVVPSDIADLLTPVSLAHWHMDDGGWTKGGIHLNTNSFTKADVQRLVDILKSKFNLTCSVQSRNRLYIWSGSAPLFCDIIRPHIHPSMVYKITPL